MRKKRRIQELEIELQAKQNELNRLRTRLRVLGSEKNYKSVNIRDVRSVIGEVKSPIQPWGTYSMVSADLLGDPIMMDEVRSKLVFQIAEGLLRQDMVKWIYHYKDEMDRDHATIAAKLYVVPWEFMEEEKHGGTD